MTMKTTCNACGFVLPQPAPGEPCPRCGGPTRTDAMMAVGAGRATITGYPVTVISTSRYASDWYADALGESHAAKGDYHARRREVVFAVCCAESYIYEWTADLLRVAVRLDADIDRYFPPKPQHGWDRGVTDQWKEVPRLLFEDGLLARRPDLGGPHGTDWLRLVDYRNGLVHALISRPEVHSPSGLTRPIVTTGDLAALEPGWAVGVVAERIRRLHTAAGTPPPDWLPEP